ncbi:hypothetical protein Trydic_g21441 [Trypoxylus dichotomus]
MQSKTLLLIVIYASAVCPAPRQTPYYKPLSEKDADRLASWDRLSSKQNIWQLSGQSEGDMIYTPDQRNGLVNERYRWPNNEVPYEVDSIFNEAQASQIREAVKAFAASSCVTVRPKTDEDVDYVYVTVRLESAFQKYEANYITNFGQPYDYYSVMHYDAYAFTANGEPTVIPLDETYFSIIGRVTEMSEIDIRKLNLMYCLQQL